MIRLTRDSIKKPAVLASVAQTRALKRLAEFFTLPLEKRTQRRPPYDAGIYAATEVLAALAELSHHKCAFCETPFQGEADLVVEHFRPRSGALDLDGSIYPEHYWWLSYTWENLYPICADCNRMKGSRFPVRGNRAQEQAGPTELALEMPLLLDPCMDAPEKHLVFEPEGRVVSSTERGQATIDILGLNRTILVAARRQLWTELAHSWEQTLTFLKRGETPPPEYDLSRLLDPAQPYAAVRLQFLSQHLDDFTRSKMSPTQLDEVQTVIQEAVRPDREESRQAFRSYQTSQESYSLENGEQASSYFSRTRLVERIRIHNFKIIEDLDLTLTTGGTSQAPWLSLLGENGSGKSSVLQALGLTLVGETYRDQLPIHPEDVLRYGCAEGSVSVTLSGVQRPIELHFRKGAECFETNTPEPKVLLLGYGATRLLPRAGVQPAPGTDAARVDNLYNPFIPLQDAENWLMHLSEPAFQQVALALKELLSLEENDQLARRNGRVEVDAFGTTVTLKQLSDGYQSVLALATDIMAVMLERWPSMDVAEGIVLVDEIGAHQHPRWKMRIVKSLRRVFPRVQFLTSTHDPLCLRGLLTGEVVVMRRTTGDQTLALTDLPPVEGLRVDQLLTSEIFGLSSTMDPEVDALFQEYYKLLALRRRSVIQEKRLSELKAQLASLDQMGSTRREQLMLELVDEYLSKEPELLPPAEGEELKDETRQKAAEIWARLGGQERSR